MKAQSRLSLLFTPSKFSNFNSILPYTENSLYQINALSIYLESNVLFCQVDLLFYRVSPLFCKVPILAANCATDLFVRYFQFKFIMAATNLKLAFYGFHIPNCFYVSCRVFSQRCLIVMIHKVLSFF